MSRLVARAVLLAGVLLAADPTGPWLSPATPSVPAVGVDLDWFPVAWLAPVRPVRPVPARHGCRPRPPVPPPVRPQSPCLAVSTVFLDACVPTARTPSTCPP